MASIPFFVFLVAAFLLNPICFSASYAGAVGVPQSHIRYKNIEPEQAIKQETENSTGKHFVLVHGSNLGAWSWYKVITLLRSAGHNVTALDLAGNGRDPRTLEEVTTFFEYAQPLTDYMDSLPDGETVILVGHSYGGFSISLTMERYPEKISVAVYVTAYMPNYTVPTVTLQEAFFNWPTANSLLDSIEVTDSNDQPVSILFGPEYIETYLYNDSPKEDQELAKTLVRPTGFYLSDLNQTLLTQGNFGSVTRVFITSSDDQVLPLDFQQYMIANSPPAAVKSVNGSDHMVMVSKPQELYQYLQEIADTY